MKKIILASLVTAFLLTGCDQNPRPIAVVNAPPTYVEQQPVYTTPNTVVVHDHSSDHLLLGAGLAYLAGRAHANSYSNPHIVHNTTIINRSRSSSYSAPRASSSFSSRRTSSFRSRSSSSSFSRRR